VPGLTDLTERPHPRRQALAMRNQRRVVQPHRRVLDGRPDGIHTHVAALDSAVARRGDSIAGCVLHSDRSSQFRSRKLQQALFRHRMLGSMGPGRLRLRQRRNGELLQPAPEQRPQPPNLRHPRAAADRHRHLDRTHLPPTPPTSHTRPIDPHRVRDHHEPDRRPGGLTAVTYSCSRPELVRRGVN
jgi:hypothetical protein